jgi:hypothetical protein
MLKSGFKDGPFPWIEKDPQSLLDYTLDWSAAGSLGGPWLQTGETISGAATWTVPTGLTKDHQVDTGSLSTIWLSGGTAGQSCTVTCRITTTSGRIDERSFVVVVKQR